MQRKRWYQTSQKRNPNGQFASVSGRVQFRLNPLLIMLLAGASMVALLLLYVPRTPPPFVTGATITFDNQHTEYGLSQYVQEVVVTNLHIKTAPGVHKLGTGEGEFMFGNKPLSDIEQASLQVSGVVDRAGQGCLHVGVQYNNLESASYDAATGTLRITLKRAVTADEAASTDWRNSTSRAGYIAISTTCS
ncbi:MAG TPA: hypothetical protein VNG90_05610 [Candidatus Acidoferrum sp.]|nr:hypothetical protein [Candidatus Acidoferrum sp.]